MRVFGCEGFAWPCFDLRVFSAMIPAMVCYVGRARQPVHSHVPHLVQWSAGRRVFMHELATRV